jgi:hypothetical protein
MVDRRHVTSDCQSPPARDQFAELVPPLAPLLLRVAAALVGTADAEDVAQEAILRAWQHWAPVSQLQFSAVDDLHVVSNPGAAYPTVYLTTSNLANVQTPEITRATQVRISRDGGKTWSTVPTKGIPAGWSAIDVVAQTSDGSAITLFGLAGSVGVELYSWQPGGSSWLPVAFTPGTSTALYLVTSSQATPGVDTLWAVSVSGSTVGGVPYTSVVYRLQL